jgi:hypothetical protein
MMLMRRSRRRRNRRRRRRRRRRSWKRRTLASQAISCSDDALYSCSGLADFEISAGTPVIPT